MTGLLPSGATRTNLSDIALDQEGLVWPMSDDDRMQTAMIAWEAFNDIQNDELGANGPLNVYRDKVGAYGVRQDLASLIVEALHIGWHVHEKAADELTATPFDWEFAPWFMTTCVEYDPAGWVSLKPDWLDLCRDLRATF